MKNMIIIMVFITSITFACTIINCPSGWRQCKVCFSLKGNGPAVSKTVDHPECTPPVLHVTGGRIVSVSQYSFHGVNSCNEGN